MADYCPEDQQRISVWYGALQDAGFTGTQTPGLRHHISLATFLPEQEAQAIALTKALAARFAPVNADIRHVGVFPGGRVLFAAPDLILILNKNVAFAQRLFRSGFASFRSTYFQYASLHSALPERKNRCARCSIFNEN
ncbi:MAG: hypothetical protein ACI4MG_02935 [Aristaeellaceae bacterium]